MMVNDFEKLKTKYDLCPDFCDTRDIKRWVDSRFGWIYLTRRVFISRPKLCTLRTSFREFLVWELHAGGLVGHFEIEKTLEAIEYQFYWPSLKQDVGMNFVLCLLKTLRKHDSVLVVVDHFSKMAHFLLCSWTFVACRVVKIFFDGIVKLHCLPKFIVSDRDFKFTSYFWKTLWHMLITKLNFSTAFPTLVKLKLSIEV